MTIEAYRTPEARLLLDTDSVFFHDYDEAMLAAVDDAHDIGLRNIMEGARQGRISSLRAGGSTSGGLV